MQHKVRLSHSLLAVESDHRVHLMLDLTAPPAPASDHPPVSLALVLDRSGSMGGRKIQAVKQCAKFLVDRLRPEDRFALIDFEHDVRLLVASSKPDRKALRHAIDSIEVAGATNLSGGWLKGLEEARRPEGRYLRRVLLLTDGQANVGIRDAGELAAMAQNARGRDVVTSTIGFGEGFSEDLLTGMAAAGGGDGYFAASPEDAPAIFDAEYTGLASIVAQNLSVEVRPTAEVQLLHVLNEYPSTGVPGGVQLNLGDAYGEDERRVLVELLVPGVGELGEVKIADLVLRYVSVGEEVASHEITVPVTANLVEKGKGDTGPDVAVLEEVTVLLAAEARRKARELAEEGRLDDAANVLGVAERDLRALAEHSPRRDELTEDADELKRTSEQMRAREYGGLDAKRMHYERHRSMSTRRSRHRDLHRRLRKEEETRRRREEETGGETGGGAED
ncbi:MAG: VWA domain-containing protein [Planctomycetota bacterium]